MSDAIIDQLIQKLNTRRAAAKALTEKYKSWETNKSFILPGTTGVKNIGVMTKEELVAAQAAMIQMRDYHSKACEDLGFDSTVQTYLGFTPDQWSHDLKRGAANLVSRGIDKEADVMEKQLMELVSPEKMREIKLQQLTAAIDTL